MMRCRAGQPSGPTRLPQSTPDILLYAVAAEHGVEAPGAAAVAELFERAIAAGDGDRYFPVIRKQLV